MQMNNEPVAWMLLGLEDRKPKLINLQVIDHLEGTWIPLYTHPANLTDEEIADFEWAIKNVLNFSQSEKVVGLDNVIRAILRKAQEK